MMTTGDIENRVNSIAVCCWDNEVAHSLEDKLHQDVLREIAKQRTRAGGLARAALKTLDIDYDRWYT